MAEKEQVTHANVSLSSEHLKAVQKLQMKVGSKVRLVLYGELSGMSQHASPDQTDIAAVPSGGSIDMVVSKLRVASNNEIAELFDEEFDE